MSEPMALCGALAFAMIGAGISAAIAGHKQRNVGGWLLFGFLIPVIAVTAIICLPSKPVAIANGTWS